MSRSRQTATDDFFDALERLAGRNQVYYMRPFTIVGDGTGDVLGNLEVYVRPRQSDSQMSVHLAFIGTTDRRQGKGRALMKLVLQAADEAQLPVDLEVNPQKSYGESKPPMNKTQLRKFYESFGFHTVKKMGRDYMERE